MAELAKLYMSVVDESFYGAGTGAIIPLYIIATESNKVLDSTTGEIAPGTTMANELLVMTSQKDVINTFGVPSFEKVNGTVMQGSELNEVGLLGLYDAMGSSALGYAVRADIDLGQLHPTSVAPTSSVDNGSKWLDTAVSTFGVYVNNGENHSIASRNWEYVDVKAVEELSDDGLLGEIAFLITEEGGEFYEYFEDGWCLIGSEEWKAKIGNPSADVTFASHLSVPTGKVQGSIWIQTTQPNDGSKYVKKTYKSSIKSWIASVMSVYGSYAEAERSLSLSLGSDVVFYEQGLGKVEVKKYINEGKSTFIVGNSPLNDDKVEGKFVIISKYTNEPIVCEFTQGELAPSADQAIAIINQQLKEHGVKDIVADKVDGKFVLESKKGYTVQVKNTFMNPLGRLKVTNNSSTEGCWADDKEMVISNYEPVSAPKDGTMWFDDSIKVDIMANNGQDWVGFNVMYPEAKIYVTSEEPEEPTDLSVWVDTNVDSYPMIYRYFDGVWNLVDKTDQTSSLGVVFGDARYYADDEEPSYKVVDSIVESNLLTASKVDPDCPDPTSYPRDILLFNTRFSTNNVKEYKADAFAGLYDTRTMKYMVGETEFTMDPEKLARWKTVSGNALDGSGLFGRDAQRKMVAEALSGAINSCEELKSINYDFFFACCPGYPEVDEALYNLNADKKEMFYVVTDTPKGLKPTVRAITDWAQNSENATHGEKGRVIRNAYSTRQYPSMGITSNVDGTSVAIPTSIVKMNNLLNLPTGQICAGTQFGVVSNVSSVGYITDEDEYASVSVNDGLGEAIVAQSMNPIMARRNTGLLFWGENTEYNATSSLSDEHAILTLLRLKRELEVAVQPFFFRKNTQAVRNDFDRAIRNILTSYVASEELYDFALDTESPNTSETIERKELHANIAIEIVKGIEFIYLPIRVVNTGSLSDSTLAA